MAREKENPGYELRFSFAALDNKNIRSLNDLRQRFQNAGTGPMTEFCKKLGLTSESIDDKDRVEDISIVRVNRGDRPYGYFHVTTKTVHATHAEFWRDICTKMYPDIMVAVIGRGADGKQICQTLYQPVTQFK